MKKLPNIEQNIADWYQEVIYQSELADQSPVRGCIVIRPYGYALWEAIKSVIDKRIKETGHENASFPLLIPESFLKKEAEHVEGFAPELAVVTHAGGKKLEEPLVIRPTSETIVHHMFARWIKSWRDLPLKINQWANVVRWEMRTRPFLRTTEFFWQEGHTAHETEKEAESEAEMMLQEYVDFAHNYLAIPVITGIKSESEKFAGADRTYTFEALLQDGKALQMGTSHIISRNFARAFGIEYQNREGKIDYPYLTSWAVSSRLIGAIVMMHGDQKGLVLPPKIAPLQVVIIPIYRKDDEKETVLEVAHKLVESLKSTVRVKLDDDDQATPGAKFYRWELKGVPVRIEIGPRDVQAGQAVVVSRVSGEKQQVSLDSISGEITKMLDQAQAQLFERAQQKVESLHLTGDKLTDFGKKLDKEGGMYQTGWCQKTSCEEQLKRYKATIRCLLDEQTAGNCFHCGEKSAQNILVAKAY